MKRLHLIMLMLLCAALPASHAQERTPAEARLAKVETWLYLISVDLDPATLDEIAASTYNMVVMDPIVTEQQNTNYDITATVKALQAADKLVIAYMDIGQAEDYRTYWQDAWRIGDPEWIVGDDPDGWTGNYPVAFWWDEWQALWFDPQSGLLQLLLDAGFDGIYMDWVEAYSDENVVAFADAEGVDPQQEMLWFIEDISAYTKAQREDFIVIAQNAAELVVVEGYLDLIDGLAQEAVWFDGAADGLMPEGDCPLPATDADIDTEAYRASLSPECLHLLDTDPESQLHTSSAEYLEYLTMAQESGEIVLTVDYALQGRNTLLAHNRARSRGFVPFLGPRALDRFIPPHCMCTRAPTSP